jgi:hypothetical protein
LVLEELRIENDTGKAFIFFKDYNTLDKILRSGVEHELVG